MGEIDVGLVHRSVRAALAEHRRGLEVAVELVPCRITAADLARVLRNGPTVVTQPGGGVLLVVSSNRRTARLRGPDGRRRSVPVGTVVDAAAPIAARLAPGGASRPGVERLLRLEPLTGVHALVAATAAAASRRPSRRLVAGLAAVTAFEITAGILFLLAWRSGVGWLAHRGAGAVDTLVPLLGAALAQLAAAAASRDVQIGAEERVRAVAAERVLDAPPGARPQGAGALLAAASEANKVGAELGPLVALSLTAATSLVVAGAALGAVAPGVTVSIIVTAGLSVAVGRGFAVRRAVESGAQRALGRRSHDLLAASRALRLAAPGTVDALSRSEHAAARAAAGRVDRLRVGLSVALPRLWLVGAIATLTATVSPGRAPLAIGATLLAAAGLRALGLALIGVGDVRAALAAARAVAPQPATPAITGQLDRAASAATASDPYLRGPNASGRSTRGRGLAAADPDAMFAPAAEEDHVFTATLLENVLFGRGAPYSDAQRAEAVAVLEQLQLGPLLAKAPFGIDTLVGETGWRLSEGERARILLARALLAERRTLVVDELLEPLDAITRDRVLAVCADHTDRLIVIAPE